MMQYSQKKILKGHKNKQMAIQDYDPFALKQYAFTLQKSHKYFTFTTVLISIGVIIMSIYLSMDTISHLWIPRSQLPTYVTQSNEGPGPLSSTLLCYTAIGFTGNDTYPSFIAYDYNLNPIQFETVLQGDAVQMYPNLTTIINGSFQCIDLAGLRFTYLINNFFIEILTELPVAFALQHSSYESLIDQSGPVFTFYDVDNDYQVYYKEFAAMLYLTTFTSAQIYDSLWPNSDPEIINTFASFDGMATSIKVGAKNNYTVINIRSYEQPNVGTVAQYNLFTLKTNVSITRNDIGAIIGAVLGWISTLSFAFGIMLIPIIERSKVLTQVECSYVLEKPYRNPSLFRFIVASFRSGIYPKEDVIVQMSEELEQRKNIAYLVKVVKAVRDSYPSHVYGIDVVCRADDFNDPKVNFHYPLEPYNNPVEPRRIAADFATEDPKVPMESDFVEKRKSFLKWLDTGSDSPTMFYEGHGYGSKASVVLSVIFGVGFLVFLQMFGILQYNTTVRKYNMRIPNSTYELQYNQFTFVTKKSAKPIIQLLDGNYNLIANITPLLDETKCRAYLTPSNYLKIINIPRLYRPYCLSQNITLVNSPNPEQTRLLYLNSPTNLIQSVLNQIDTTYSQDAISLALFAEVYQYYKFAYRTKLKLHHQIIDGNQVGKAPMSKYQKFSTGLQRFNSGVVIELDDSHSYVDSSTSTLFDLTQTVWGLATICFTVILMKISRYINIARRNSLITKQLAEFRESLCILLVKVNALLSGKRNPELNRRRHYLKYSIDTWIPTVKTGISLFKSAPKT